MLHKKLQMCQIKYENVFIYLLFIDGNAICLVSKVQLIIHINAAFTSRLCLTLCIAASILALVISILFIQLLSSLL